MDRRAGRTTSTDGTVLVSQPLTLTLVAVGVVGGSLHVLKGAVLLSGGPDLSLVPAMLLFFALGMVALGRTVAAPDGWARAGSVLAWVAAAFGVGSLGCQLAGWQPEDPADPVVADVAYAGGTLAILVGLVVLGIAWAKDLTIALPWRLAPLAVGVVWFPLEALTTVLPDGGGLTLAGLTWIVAASAPIFAAGQGAPAR